MKRLLKVIFFVTLGLTLCKSKAQCIEVEELYAIADSNEIDWDTLTLPKKSLLEISQSMSKIEKGVTFFTPFIVNHIRLFHPSCSTRVKKEEYDLLINTYNRTLGKDYSTDFSKREQTCDKVIEDFKVMCRVDSLFGRMLIVIFETGPHFGEKVSKLQTKFSVADSLDIGIGKVFSLTDSDGEYYAFSTKTNEYEWVFKATECMIASNSFSKFSKNSLGFVIRLGSGDFATRLYLDNQGRFRFYICELD